MSIDRHLTALLERPCVTTRERASRWRRIADLLSRDDGTSDDALVARALSILAEDRDMVAPATRKLVARILSERDVRSDLAELVSSEVERLLISPQAEAGRAPSVSEMIARLDQSGPHKGGTKDAAPAILRTPFFWESDSMGTVRWVDGAPRAALIGRRLAGSDGQALLSGGALAKLAAHETIEDAPLALADSFTGGEPWLVDAIPCFDPDDGHFIGYRGDAHPVGVEIELRPSKPEATLPDASSAEIPEGPDLLRELAHEVKTPLNAIIGFAEIIDGQYLGPAHRPYRKRAAGIAVQARRLLNAVGDLDLAAQLHAKGAIQGEGTEFTVLFPKIAAKVHERGADTGVEFLYKIEGRFRKCALDPKLAERLVMRLAETVMGAADAGESLLCTVGHEGRFCCMRVDRPNSLRGIASEKLLDPAFDIEGHGRLGIGFSLRLLRGLAGLALGELRIKPSAFELLIPGKVD